jgi:hypothetical protein
MYKGQSTQHKVTNEELFIVNREDPYVKEGWTYIIRPTVFPSNMKLVTFEERIFQPFDANCPLRI